VRDTTCTMMTQNVQQAFLTQIFGLYSLSRSFELTEKPGIQNSSIFSLFTFLPFYHFLFILHLWQWWDLDKLGVIIEHLHGFFPMLAIKMLDLSCRQLTCTSIGPVNTMNCNRIFIGIQMRTVPWQNSTGSTKSLYGRLHSPLVENCHILQSFFHVQL